MAEIAAIESIGERAASRCNPPLGSPDGYQDMVVKGSLRALSGGLVVLVSPTTARWRESESKNGYNLSQIGGATAHSRARERARRSELCAGPRAILVTSFVWLCLVWKHRKRLNKSSARQR